MSREEFLRSDISGRKFLVNRGEEKPFGRFMAKYNSGKLQPLDVKRSKERKYEPNENKLVKYIQL